MASQRRITQQTRRILAAMLTQPDHEWWGTEIAPRTNLKSGTLYPALIRMERFGWLASRWEEIDASQAGRPRRRLYRLTGEGALVARSFTPAVDLLAERQPSCPPPRWSATPGAQPV